MRTMEIETPQRTLLRQPMWILRLAKRSLYNTRLSALSRSRLQQLYDTHTKSSLAQSAITDRVVASRCERKAVQVKITAVTLSGTVMTAEDCMSLSGRRTHNGRRRTEDPPPCSGTSEDVSNERIKRQGRHVDPRIIEISYATVMSTYELLTC